MTSTRQWLHGLFYRIGLLAVFCFFMGFMVFVLVKAQSRKSGATAMNARQVLELRQGVSAPQPRNANG